MTYQRGDIVHYFRTTPPKGKHEAVFVDQQGLRCRVTFQDKGSPRTVSTLLSCIDKVREGEADGLGWPRQIRMFHTHDFLRGRG